MKAKINWYREVLELEPGSKVFFPLARLLAENGQTAEALSVLRLGLERHPEFIEARLYLTELLYANGEISQCEPQIEQLTRLFSGYPGFWEAWGMCAASAGQARELSLALKFLAVLFKGQDIGFADILERGLCTLGFQSSSLPEQAMESRQGTAKPAAQEEFTASAESSADLSFSTPSFPEEDPPDSADDAEETEEPFSLRTRSMADILAGQGDVAGAMEIYRELFSGARSIEERDEIEECMQRLSSSQTGAEIPPPAPSVSQPGRQRVQHLLESLAERLEARAAG